MNLYQKLIEVRKAVPYLKKENSGYQFNYVSSSQVLGNLKAKMDELGVLLIPSVVTKELQEKTTQKGGKEYLTELVMEFVWINAENPEEQIKCGWYGQGLDSGEKGVGKALTYSEKYFMLKFFNIPTDKDDPDSFQEKVGSDNTQGKKQSDNGKTGSGNKPKDSEISPDNIKALHAIRSEFAIDEDEFKNRIGKMLKREIVSLKDITNKEAEKLKATLNKKLQEKKAG